MAPPTLTRSASRLQLAMGYDEAFELTGHGVFNHIVLASCSLIFMHALIEMVAIAYILDPAMCDIGLTVKEKASIGSGIFIGIVASAICWGSISDRFGRKKVMLPALVLAVAASFGSSMCTSFWPMFLLRILTGIMVSASMATVLVYLGELHTHEHRDIAISWAVTSVAIVFVVVPGIAWLIIPGKWSFSMGSILIKPWRVFMWTWGFIGLAGAIILAILPESPNFVLATKGPYYTLPILIRIYSWNHRKSPSVYPVTTVLTSSIQMHSGDAGLKTTLADMSQLLRRPILRCFLLTHYAMFMVYLLANGIYLWMPNFYNTMLDDTSLPQHVCYLLTKPANSTEATKLRLEPYAGGGMDCETGKINDLMYVMAIIMEIIFLLPFLVVSFIIEKYSKLLLYACVMVPCGVCLIVSVVVPQIIASVGVFLTIGLCSGSGASILSALAVDAFPTSLRALAMCTMYMLGQVGAVIGNLLVTWSTTGPCTLIFIAMGASCIASAALLFLFWPDLHNVRTEMESRGFSY